jgi:hypothetical protein
MTLGSDKKNISDAYEFELTDPPAATAAFIDYVCYAARFGMQGGPFTLIPECRTKSATFQVMHLKANRSRSINVKNAQLVFDLPRPMDAVDFLVDWRDLQGKTVTVHGCHLSVGRSTGTHISCAVGTGSGRITNHIIIEEKTFARESYRRFLKECNGNGQEDSCTVDLIGTPSGEFLQMPVMHNVHAIWPEAGREAAEADRIKVEAEQLAATRPAEANRTAEEQIRLEAGRLAAARAAEYTKAEADRVATEKAEHAVAQRAQPSEAATIRRRDARVLQSNPADRVYTGPLRLPDFSGRDRTFSSYRTRIRDGMRDGPNFAGKLALIEIGCGTSCRIVYAGDLSTGRVYDIPLGGEDNPSLTLHHNLGSRAIVAYWGNADSCTREVFVWQGSQLERKERSEISSAESCSALLGYAPPLADP